MMGEISKEYVFILLVGLTVFARFVIGPALLYKEVKLDAVEKSLAVTDQIRINPFKSLELKAQAAFVLDVNTGETIYKLNSEAQLPLASLTKLMTAIVTHENLPHSVIVSVGSESLKQEGDNGLKLGEQWRIRDLINLTLVASSNDGAHALASALDAYSVSRGGRSITQSMNEKAGELGLEQTYFINETGLDFSETSVAGAYGSAQDVAKMFAYVINKTPELVEATTESRLKVRSLDNIEHNIKNTNDSINSIPWVMGSKTGFTDLAGGNLVVAFDAGLMRPVIIVVLGSTIDGRFEDTKKLIASAFEHFAKS